MRMRACDECLVWKIYGKNLPGTREKRNRVKKSVLFERKTRTKNAGLENV